MTSIANRMFHILDVNLPVPMGVATNAFLEKLQASLGGDFELEALEPTSAKMLRVRIICVDAEYPNVDAMEAAIREVADAEIFPWQRFGGVPVGETVTMQY
ncbi:hypothetical protein LPN04_31135 [Rugamonas sp. A1-17]|nr:hypothetical protein [Rugamonas sp. A1-17]